MIEASNDQGRAMTRDGEETIHATTVELSLGYTLKDRDLLRRALTHRSFANERGEQHNYERLEFLGDSVLGLVTAQWLFRRSPGRPEGELAKLKSYLVSAPVLAHFARSIRLGPQLLLGIGEDRSGGREKESILADSLEAIFGAVYLDGGLQTAQLVIEPILEKAIQARARISHRDSKTLLQELSQARGWGLPTYLVASEEGPDHCKVFTIACAIGGNTVASAKGKSKKEAAQRAAAAALSELDLLADDPVTGVGG